MTMTNFHELDLDSAKEELGSLVNKGYKIYLTGRSGSGKDFIAAKLMNNPKNWCFIDKYGKQDGDKWIVNIPSEVASKCVAFVGIGDRMDDIMKQISEASKGKLAVVWIMPSPEIYRAAAAAKAKDATDVPKSWIQGWLSNSKLSDGKVRKELLKKRADSVAKIKSSFMSVYPEAGPDDLLFFTLVNNVLEGEIKNGWHGSTKRVTADTKKEGGDE